MKSTALTFFKRILETPSPSGYESPLQQIVRDYAADFADQVKTDVHGNVIDVKNHNAPLRVMLAGHSDQIGLIVQHIDDEGFLYIREIGGWDPQMLIGQRMTVWTDGGPVPGPLAEFPFLQQYDAFLDASARHTVKLTMNGATLNFPTWKGDSEGAIIAVFDYGQDGL